MNDLEQLRKNKLVAFEITVRNNVNLNKYVIKTLHTREKLKITSDF